MENCSEAQAVKIMWLAGLMWAGPTRFRCSHVILKRSCKLVSKSTEKVPLMFQ